jgi:hypothetical protein
MTLWTVQPAAALAEIRRDGTLRARPPADPRWRRAYEWMAAEMAHRGIVDGTGAGPAGARRPALPVWAWRSCGRPGHGPDAGTVRALLSDAEMEREPVVIEFGAPAGLVLLSVYAAWNEVLDGFIGGAAGPPEARLVWTLFDVGAARLDGGGDADHIQACVPRVERGWVRGVERISAR